jgi:hypothetical protein
MVDTKALYPIAVLIDELKSEDQKKRLVISLMKLLHPITNLLSKPISSPQSFFIL